MLWYPCDNKTLLTFSTRVAASLVARGQSVADCEVSIRPARRDKTPYIRNYMPHGLRCYAHTHALQEMPLIKRRNAGGSCTISTTSNRRYTAALRGRERGKQGKRGLHRRWVLAWAESRRHRISGALQGNDRTPLTGGSQQQQRENTKKKKSRSWNSFVL